MKINKSYRLSYEMDIIYIQKNEAGTWTDLCPISDTAAMAWEGLERNLPTEELAEAICTEFAGSSKDQVLTDLAALTAQLKALGILED